MHTKLNALKHKILEHSIDALSAMAEDLDDTSSMTTKFRHCSPAAMAEGMDTLCHAHELIDHIEDEVIDGDHMTVEIETIKRRTIKMMSDPAVSGHEKEKMIEQIDSYNREVRQAFRK